MTSIWTVVILAGLLAAPTPGADGLVVIPGGVFAMGDGAGDLEAICRPVHQVRLSIFRLAAGLTSNRLAARWLDWALERKLVTASATAVDLAGGGGERLLNLAGLGPIPSDLYLQDGRLRVRDGREEYPLVFVTWFGAAALCNFRSQMEGLEPCFSQVDWSCDFTRNGYRLPTEAEYEYAARNRGSAVRYPWGGGRPEQGGRPLANVADDTGESHFAKLKVDWRNPIPLPWPGYADGYATTSPVRAYPPSPLGLYDIAGNAWEFCYDWYGPYPASPQSDPSGPAAGERKCMRGGSWMNPDPHVFRGAYRDEDRPTFQYSHAGFRMARSMTLKSNQKEQNNG
jgi:formylglycine-generating enzyme required for sulfatase activity